MGRPPRHISESLRSLIGDLGFEKRIDQVKLMQKWPDIVGENIAQIAVAERVSDGILYVKVKSMTWRTELLFQRQNILERITRQFGDKIITDIRFI
ncbi:DUF721 domain-containing protein [candidate division KSB1 bacterium]|nr:DUF721 domain-containing protein [candidate division KSB1 bacterium]RQW02434.1 MAG: DUF721 domain-containing protein [candidate division KSB1 bacterium]